MRFINFIKKHWKASALFIAIVIATTVGVVLVRASSISMTLDTAALNFASTGSEYAAEVKVTSLVVDSTGGDTNGSYTWSIADNSVATVSILETGRVKITPVGAGVTSLEVTYKLNNENTSTSKTIPISVALNVNYSNVSGILMAGNMNYTVSANAATGKVVTWSSSNSSVVSVNSINSYQANITPVSGGTATITATISSDSLSFSFRVTVGVSITTTGPVTVAQGQNQAIVTNSNSPSNVFWWSDDEKVATVVNGVINGVYAGTTNIYASCKDHDASNNAGSSISVVVPYTVSVPSTTVIVGDMIGITTTADPANVSMVSNNNNVIIYDAASGKFKAVSTGQASITVTWGSETQTIDMTVIDGFYLSTTTTSLNIGASSTVVANVSNSTSPVHWTISDPDMVQLSVSEDGLTATVKAVATGVNPYTTLVATQEIDGVVKSASCKVYVLNPVTNLTLMYNGTEIKNVISVAKASSIYITAYLNFGEAVVPDNTKLSWISSDTSVITVAPVTASGQQQLCQINAVGGGNATITVVSEDGLYIATADFYVTEGVTGISLDSTDVTAQMALQKFQLTATVKPDSSGVDHSVVWASLDPNVVKVDQNGLVTFVGPGETYVSATSAADSTKIAYCRFHITQQVEGIAMDYDKVTLNVGDEYRLTAVISPANASNKNVTWSSSNEAVVKVDANGMLQAMGSGSATIIVQTADGGYIDMTNVTVLQPVTKITLSQTEMSVKKGTVFWLNATISPETADNKKVTWSPSDKSLATVDQDGKVTTLAVGTVTIACVSQDNGTVAYCIIEITEPVTGLSLNTYYQEMVTGTKFVIIPTVLPTDAINKAVTYVSSDTSVATVDANGVVSAIKGGECQIIVTTVESSVEAVCTIKVKEFVSSIEISGNPENLNVGSFVDLKATVGSETATNKMVYWTSSDNSVATVDQTGRVTGLKPGTIVISATAADGSGVSASVIIRVINAVTSITLSESKITIYVGDTFNINATVNPANASIKGLTWTSDDSAVARVYSDGDVVGVTAGRTVVHATSNDGNNVVANCTVIVKNRIPASSISINSSDITMLKGKTRTLTARLFPTNSNESIKWLSTDTSIVQVDGNGTIVTVGAGVCDIVAYSTNGTVEDSCTIHSIAMSCTGMNLEQYDTFNLYVDGAPSAVSWRSSNPRIASVTQGGVVTGRMPGECTITATVDGKTVTCYVKVMAVDPGKFINRN